MMRSNTEDDPNYRFTSPYPKPQFEYPTSRSRISLSANGTRSPSPTPSEIEEAKQPFIPTKFFSLEFYKRPKVILWIIVFIIIGILSVLLTIYHKQIEAWLRPAADWMKSLKFGYLIPIGILFVISFPPLFGHEIVAVLCGNVWGLWEGFGIVCAGTLLGEIGNFYAFKYLCSTRGQKYERESFFYGCLARAVREGGFIVAVMARLSVIPGHFTTAIFATCGMNIIVFVLAAILSLPKQFVTVYLGVLLEQSAGDAKSTSHQKLISDLVVAGSIVVTSVAMWFIIHKMKAQRLAVVRDRRRRLQGAAGLKPYEEGRVPLRRNESSSSLVSDEVFNPGISDADLAGRPMEVEYNDRERYRYDYDRRAAGGPSVPVPQRWDERGHAIEMTDDSYSDGYGYNAYPPSRTPQKTSPALQPSSIPPVAPIPVPPPVTAPITYAPPSSPPPHLRASVNPYGGIASPPQQQTFLPPSGPPPPIVQQLQTSVPIPVPGTLSIPPPPPPASSAPTSSYATAQLAPSINVTQHGSEDLMPQSPFEDKYAIQIPKHVKRYQLSDGDSTFRGSFVESSEGGGSSGEELLPRGHQQEESSSTFYSAHSRGPTGSSAVGSDVDLR